MTVEVYKAFERDVDGRRFSPIPPIPPIPPIAATSEDVRSESRST